jgi:hypothetical protein
MSGLSVIWMSASPEVIAILRELTARNDGVLLPEHVVAHAEEPTSPLHGYFTWDDEVAGHQYRLGEAARLIRTVRVEMLGRNERMVQVRAFESLPRDRGAGGGYRPITDIISSEEFRKELLESALKDLEAFQRRYSMLAELADVFAEIAKVKAKVRRGIRRPRPKGGARRRRKKEEKPSPPEERK